MARRQMEWWLSLLSLFTAIAALLLGAWAYPGDQRFLIAASACIGFALWFVIGLKPGR
ncbi:MAG TPA: hypothetical protein VNT77_09585 [Allosphingosinicella sp.]|nr:hypothetical protein [Allosphingosinicella sp.]